MSTDVGNEVLKNLAENLLRLASGLRFAGTVLFREGNEDGGPKSDTLQGWASRVERMSRTMVKPQEGEKSKQPEVAFDPCSAELVNVDAAAALLGCSRRTVFRMMYSGALKYIRYSPRCLRVVRSSITEFLGQVAK